MGELKQFSHGLFREGRTSAELKLQQQYFLMVALMSEKNEAWCVRISNETCLITRIVSFCFVRAVCVFCVRTYHKMFASSFQLRSFTHSNCCPLVNSLWTFTFLSRPHTHYVILLATCYRHCCTTHSRLIYASLAHAEIVLLIMPICARPRPHVQNMHFPLRKRRFGSLKQTFL